MSLLSPEQDLVQRIRRGDEAAWRECIAEYAGRLHAFVLSRLGNEQSAEDLVQETFLGFLTALPHFDENRSLESFLFAIAAHKMIDVLRRTGRRPLLALPAQANTDHPGMEPVSQQRVASSLARSQEERAQQAEVIATRLRIQIQQWLARGEFERLKCTELLFVRGLSNKETARILGITEQDVANHKQFLMTKLKTNQHPPGRVPPRRNQPFLK